MTLTSRDKTLASHRFGYDFHHAEPQRRLPCILGDMLVPASADDIPPIGVDAMRSVEAALDLLQRLIGDPDHNLFLGNVNHDGHCDVEAAAIRRVMPALRAILRVTVECPRCGQRGLDADANGRPMAHLGAIAADGRDDVVCSP